MFKGKAFACSLIASVSLAVVPLAGLSEDVAITNWAAPPFWMASSPASNESASSGTAKSQSTRETLAALSTPMPFTAIDPCRVVDTRAGSGFSGQYGPPALATTFIRTFTITGQCGIPAGAQAVSFQFTAVNMTSNGNFRAWPASSPMPFASVLNWTATQGVAGNGIVVPVDGSGDLSIYVNGPGGNTVDLVLDVNGYYAPAGIVNSVNTLSGDVTLAAGTNVTITPASNTLTIDAAGATGARTGATGPTGADRQHGRDGPGHDREQRAPRELRVTRSDSGPPRRHGRSARVTRAAGHGAGPGPTGPQGVDGRSDVYNPARGMPRTTP